MVRPVSIRRRSGRSDSANGCGHTARDFHSSTSAAPPNQATSLESQMIHRIQLLPGQTLRPWTGRVRDLGHGRPHPMAVGDALEIAKTSEPASPGVSIRQPEDPDLGSTVKIRAVDYAKDAIVGTLTFLDDDEVSIRTMNDRVGEIAVHFPRVGFEMRVERGNYARG